MVAYKIGRGPTNDIVVEDSSVSRCHAELRVSDDRILLVDLGSTNGTCVRENGRWTEIEKASVADDERILLGEVVTTVSALIARRKEPAEPLAVRHMPVAERTTPSRRDRETDGEANGTARQASVAPLFGGEGGDHARLLGRARRPGRGAASAAPRREPEPPSREPISYEGIAARVNRRNGSDPSAVETESPSLSVGPRRADQHDTNQQDKGPAAPDRRPQSTPYIALDPGLAQASPVNRPGPFVEPRANGREYDRRRPRPAVPRPSAGSIARRSGMAAAALLVIAGCAFAAYRYGGSLGISAGSHGNLFAGAPTKHPDQSTVAAARATSLPEWRQFIGGPADDSLASAARYPDGGVVLVGTATVGEPSHTDLWAVRLDRDGKIRWRRAFGGAAADQGLAVAAAPDGGALVAGTAENRNAAWLVRLGADGDKLWDRKVRAGTGSFVSSAVALPDGGFAALIVSRDAATNKVHTALLRLDGNGEELWRRLLRDGAVRGTDLIAIREQGFAVAGTVSRPDDAGAALWIARLDATGEPVWDRTLGRAGRDARAHLRLARRDDVIAATTHLTHERSENGGVLRLVRLDRDGQTLWDHLVEKADGLEITGMFLVKGAIIVAGTADAAREALATPWVARVDTEGRIEWQRRFADLKGARAATIAERHGRRILVAGRIDRGEGRKRDGMILLLQADGRPAR